jgi:hypothetical protein
MKNSILVLSLFCALTAFAGQGDVIPSPQYGNSLGNTSNVWPAVVTSNLNAQAITGLATNQINAIAAAVVQSATNGLGGKVTITNADGSITVTSNGPASYGVSLGTVPAQNISGTIVNPINSQGLSFFQLPVRAYAGIYTSGITNLNDSGGFDPFGNFWGNGFGLTNLNSASLTGVVPQASMPTNLNIAWMNFGNTADGTSQQLFETNNTLTTSSNFYAAALITAGVGFSGDGSRLTNLSPAAATNAAGFWAAAPAGGGSGNVNSNAASTILTGNITVYGVYNGNGSGLTSLLPAAITNAAGFWAAAPAGGGGSGNVNSNAVGTIFSGPIWASMFTGLGSGLTNASGTSLVNLTNGLASVQYALALAANNTNNELAIGANATNYVKSATNGVVATANNLVPGAAITNATARGSFTVTTGIAGTNAAEFSINTNGDGVIGGVQMTNGNLAAANLILAPGGVLNITNIPPITASSNTFSLTTFTNGMPPFSYRIGWSNTYLVIIMNSNAVTFMKQIFP